MRIPTIECIFSKINCMQNVIDEHVAENTVWTSEVNFAIHINYLSSLTWIFLQNNIIADLYDRYTNNITIQIEGCEQSNTWDIQGTELISGRTSQNVNTKCTFSNLCYNCYIFAFWSLCVLDKPCFIVIDYYHVF